MDHQNLIMKGKSFLKKISPYILTIFFVLLLSISMYWIFKGDASAEESVVEARTLVALGPTSSPNLKRALDLLNQGKYLEGAKALLDLYVNATFVEKFERATSDQFPLRMPIIQFSKALERDIINLSYLPLKDAVKPADMTSDIYFDAENNQLLFPPTLFDETMQGLINERISNYEALISAHPDQQFYLYYHQTIHNSKFHPLVKYFPDADNGQSIAYFEANKPKGLKLHKFLLTSLDDHLKYYYRTDHHWNVYGILRAYEEIYDMLAQDYLNISPMLEYEKIVEFPEINFLGYMARLSFYPIKGDDFMVEVIDIPPHEMQWSGQLVEEDTRQVYFDGNYSMIPYVNHFNEFYGNVTNLIEYTFDNHADRNLLIIGSSFRNALDPLLASHYHKTYCIDLRYYPNFSMSEFLAEHKVDDILIIGDNVVALHNLDYWKIGE